MNRGIVLIANNTEQIDYVKIAKFTAQRVKQFLNLPVTLITDTKITEYPFDQVIIHESDLYQKRTYQNGNLIFWKNFDRHMAYDLTPYDHTLLLDTDYIINTNHLNNLWDINSSFLCHNTTNSVSKYNTITETFIGQYQLEMCWATVITFKKDDFTRALFDMWKMIQKNYIYYAGLYKFNNQLYRNDYALTIALNTVSGHLGIDDYTIKWPLLNVYPDVEVTKIDQTEFEFKFNKIVSNTMRPYKLNLGQTDFHCMNKFNLLDMINE